MTDQSEREKFIQWHMKEHTCPRSNSAHIWDVGLGPARTWQARAALDGGAVSGEDVPCTDCDDTGITKQTERYCSCAAGIDLRTQQPAPRDEGRDLSQASRDVLAERKAQITREGWTREHDDMHDRGEMARAAACYAWAGHDPHQFFRERISQFAMLTRDKSDDGSPISRMWPWDWAWWKPKDKRRDLVRAGALIIAEIERLDRLATQEPRG